MNDENFCISKSNENFKFNKNQNNKYCNNQKNDNFDISTKGFLNKITVDYLNKNHKNYKEFLLNNSINTKFLTDKEDHLNLRSRKKTINHSKNNVYNSTYFPKRFERNFNNISNNNSWKSDLY